MIRKPQQKPLAVFIAAQCLALTLGSQTAHAQDEDFAPSKAAPKTQSRLMEEVVVTAQKRTENVQDVPISLQAFSAEKLDALGITDQIELQRITPGLNVTEQVSYTITFLRGVGTDASIAADPSVATYIDGIYYPFSSNLAQNFGAVDRIEVLKGPQGTLFGRNATGGAIAIYTKNPEFDGFWGEALAEQSSFNTTQGRLHLNIPLGETVAISASALYTESDGFYEGKHDNASRDLHGDRAWGYRLKFRAQPTENLDINLAMSHLEMYLGAGTISYNNEPSDFVGSQVFGIEPQTGYYGEIDAEVLNETNPNEVIYGSMEYLAPWFTVKLLGSDQRMDTKGIRDLDGSPQPIAILNTPDQYIDAQSAELQILSNGEWGPDWMEWILGAFYFQAEQGFGEVDFQLLGLDLTQGTISGIQLPAALVNLLNTATMNNLPSGAFDLTGLVGTESRAAFAQATFNLTDWLDLTLGGRYQEEERFIVSSTVGLDTGNGRIEVADQSNSATDSNGNPYPAHDIQKDFTPKVSLQMRPFDDDTMIYLSWQKAIKAATYNTVAITEEPDYVAPEELTAYELGIKTNFFDGLIQLNAAIFDYSVKNLQTYYLSTFAGGIISFQNAGAAKIQGAEFDVVMPILPQWFDNLVLLGGAAYLDAVYEDFDNAYGYAEDGSFQNGDANYTGNRVIRTPELTGNLSLSKTWDFWGGPFEVAFDAYYSDEFYFEASNREASHQEAYWLLGSRVSYLYEDWDLRVTAGVRNLTDERYFTGFFASDWGTQATLSAPKSYSLQMLWNF
ncbi:TonB-dependent receptor [Spongiibacter sp. KMU-158]|uniref:TonB-dependent receptor n=1 Tax=Spongiibacter pelagi TaxID=2760804 RepID=A0A927GWF5_9GAMM|nr:TonB-dependent receptor [Spongiibacter pelagi]MBD2858887.1 TonB-dependent receptor [Spongiibacter pelagi]